MSSESTLPDPLEFMRNIWSSMHVPIPGMITPTLDVNELDKRITDLKTVEGWLRTNLGMLQMSIHALEMQRSTLSAMQALSHGSSAADAKINPFANPALWPWNILQQVTQPADPKAERKTGGK